MTPQAQQAAEADETDPAPAMAAATIGIAGGNYENGAATITLAKGKTLTLMNTADGTRYVLRLVAVS